MYSSPLPTYSAFSDAYLPVGQAPAVPTTKSRKTVWHPCEVVGEDGVQCEFRARDKTNLLR